MARRQVYAGTYMRCYRCSEAPTRRQNPVRSWKIRKHIQEMAGVLLHYGLTAYAIMKGNYLALATVFAVVILSFLIPNISQKIHGHDELSDAKKLLDLMTREVSQVQASCHSVADEVCCLRYTLLDANTETSGRELKLPLCSVSCARTPNSKSEQIGTQTGSFDSENDTQAMETAIMSHVYSDSFHAESK